ncbi:MAG: hypothetical protein ACJATT_005573 [Myxococcota bacterium]|jgi:hypothetical protein
MRWLLLGVVWVWSSSAMAVPVTLAHQGRLLDPAGSPITGAVTVGVGIYDAESSGSAVWSESYEVVANDGYYSVSLGEAGTLDAASLAGERWIQISADGSPLGTRQALHAVPHAAYADDAASMGGGAIRPTDSGGLRVGNTVMSAFAASVPGDFNGTSYADGPLQMKTALTCGNGQGQSYMWHLEFVGHDFYGNSPFRVVSVGYSQSSYPSEIQNLGTVVDYGQVTITPYCSTDDFLSFEMGLSRTGRWHASDLLVNVLHGRSGYQRNAADGFSVTDTAEGPRF